MDVFGVKMLGVNAETGHKLLLTVAFVAGLMLLRAVIVAVARVTTGSHRNERAMFWTRQGASVITALLVRVGRSVDLVRRPAPPATGLGLFGAGLAFALQRVATALAGYLVIMRGHTFTVGDRITMCGVRGDVIAPPAVQGSDQAMWVRSRQFTGRIVTVTNDKVFDEAVYNYTREFPFIWEEITVPIPYRADRARAEAILLRGVATNVASIDRQSQPCSRRSGVQSGLGVWRSGPLRTSHLCQGALTRGFAVTTRLGADAAVLVFRRMALAFLGAEPTGGDAGLQHLVQQLLVRSGPATGQCRGRRADVSAVEIQADALPQVRDYYSTAPLRI